MNAPRPRIARLALAGLAAAALVQTVQWARVFRAEYASYCPTRQPVDTERARRRVPGLQPVAWRGPAGTVRGWFAPGRERAAVILLHGTPGSRTDVLDELQLLSARGFSVLAFDWPGHGESDGCAQWDATERATLASAVDWLAARPETRGAPVGAFGFSAGTFTLVQGAARDPRLRAVALAAPLTDMRAVMRWEYRAPSLGVVAWWPAMVAARMRGAQFDSLVPEQVVRDIAPRPLLVVWGTADDAVPEAMALGVYRRAAEPKSLLLVPGARHGGYAAVAPRQYPDRLTAFFVRALLGPTAPGATPRDST